jgi:RND family efflux transporter MFP subunit
MSDAIMSPSRSMESRDPERKRRPGWIAVVLLLLFIFGAAAIARMERRDSAVRFSQQVASAKPVVSTVASAVAPAVAELTLPGNTEAVVVADIYARATGYVSVRTANIGDRVRAGQVLARIESPELDQELARAKASVEEARAALGQTQANVTRSEEAVIEARARLEQSQANEALASATSARWSRLVEKGVLPRQEGDERQYAFSARKAETAAAQAAIRTAQATGSAARAAVVASEATVRANEANVERLERLVAFERVVAPFDGIITERMVEQGDLITAGGVGGRKLFAIAQPSVLRVQANVPQAFAPDLKEGQEASLTVRERPGRTFKGKVARTANALNAASRTLLVEVQVDNHDGALLPGMFSEVKFALPRTRIATVIPADALIANAQGTRVVVVDGDGKLHFRNVEVGRDLGTQIEIAAGLDANVPVVINPGETLTEGQSVEIAKK